ncbi:hypothetical protein EW146_g4159 [Bondarzewia mesenterica]|uniref:Pre-rRNA-processing protein PNO1 n=1 Tax=Bondarzewia mesenterica TaxID=1095465 RepID=A0A4V3XF76_9AGAM|nr:hypothetical protein EW146_g4159 [Bondarzewia mesenterica]
MAVTSTVSVTAAPARKNRRKMSKKKAPRTADDHPDTEMDGEQTSAEGSSKQPTTESPNNVQDDDELMIDTDVVPTLPDSFAPAFPPVSASAERTALKSETRRIPIPPHRMSPLKKDWISIFGPLTEMLGLQVRMNVQRKSVEVRTSKHTKEVGALQKGADFVKAFALGFDVNDSIALLRLDDLYLDSFEIKDVKTLHGDHLSRAIGRIAGQDGKTKFTIENASRTRIILADTKIHILGSFQNIKIARDAIVSLILGSPPGKVYAGLRTVSSRMRQRAL